MRKEELKTVNVRVNHITRARQLTVTVFFNMI